jgi:hypothetical protein
MACERCELLEVIRNDRIKKFVALVDDRKRHLDQHEQLTTEINMVVIELNEAWKRLDRHRRSHADKTDVA